MSAAENEQNVEQTRDKVQKWLMSEGWQISEQPHPDVLWLIRAEDAAQRRILIGKNKARPDQLHLEARVNLAQEHQKMFENLFRMRGYDLPYAVPPADTNDQGLKGSIIHPRFFFF